MSRELPSSGESHRGGGQVSGSLQRNCGNKSISTFVMVPMHVEFYFHIGHKKPFVESIQSHVGTVPCARRSVFILI